MHRLFLALPPPPDACARIEAWAREELVGLRPVPAENLHVTLAFFGEVGDAVRDELIDGVERTRWEPLAATTGGLGLFGRSAVALRLEAAREPLARVAARFGAGPVRLDPHLTVARTKAHPSSDLLDKRMPSFTFPLDRLVLFESRLRAEGPVYTALAEAR